MTNLAKDADRLRCFEQEPRATSAINHPNILTIYYIGALYPAHQFNPCSIPD